MSSKKNRRELLKYSVLTPLSLYLTSKYENYLGIAGAMAQDTNNEAALEYHMINIMFGGGIFRRIIIQKTSFNKFILMAIKYFKIIW